VKIGFIGIVGAMGADVEPICHAKTKHECWSVFDLNPAMMDACV
jgi:hypothetical protein